MLNEKRKEEILKKKIRKRKKENLQKVAIRDIKMATCILKKHVPNIVTSSAAIVLYLSSSGLCNPFLSEQAVHPNVKEIYTSGNTKVIKEYDTPAYRFTGDNLENKIVYKGKWKKSDDKSYERKIYIYENEKAEKLTKEINVYDLSEKELTELFGLPTKELVEIQKNLTDEEKQSLGNVEIILHYEDKGVTRKVKLSYKERAASFLVLMLLLVMTNVVTDYFTFLYFKAPSNLKEKLMEIHNSYILDKASVESLESELKTFKNKKTRKR